MGDRLDSWPKSSSRFVRRETDVEDARTGELLSSVVGANVAREVCERLRRLRPSGGRIRVAANGTVVTRLGDEYVVLGIVAPHEWFNCTPPRDLWVRPASVSDALERLRAKRRIDLNEK